MFSFKNHGNKLLNIHKTQLKLNANMTQLFWALKLLWAKTLYLAGGIIKGIMKHFLEIVNT